MHSYKKHTLKAIIWDGNAVSVHRPSFYSDRFLNFIGKSVFKPTRNTNQAIPKIPAIKERVRSDSDEDGSGDPNTEEKRYYFSLVKAGF